MALFVLSSSTVAVTRSLRSSRPLLALLALHSSRLSSSRLSSSSSSSKPSAPETPEPPFVRENAPHTPSLPPSSTSEPKSNYSRRETTEPVPLVDHRARTEAARNARDYSSSFGRSGGGGGGGGSGGGGKGKVQGYNPRSSSSYENGERFTGDYRIMTTSVTSRYPVSSPASSSSSPATALPPRTPPTSRYPSPLTSKPIATPSITSNRETGRRSSLAFDSKQVDRSSFVLGRGTSRGGEEHDTRRESEGERSRPTAIRRVDSSSSSGFGGSSAAVQRERVAAPRTSTGTGRASATYENRPSFPAQSSYSPPPPPPVKSERSSRPEESYGTRRGKDDRGPPSRPSAPSWFSSRYENQNSRPSSFPRRSPDSSSASSFSSSTRRPYSRSQPDLDRDAGISQTPYLPPPTSTLPTLESLSPTLLHQLRLAYMTQHARSPSSPQDLLAVLPQFLASQRQPEKKSIKMAEDKVRLGEWKRNKLDEAWVWKRQMEEELGIGSGRIEDEEKDERVRERMMMLREEGGQERGMEGNEVKRRESDRPALAGLAALPRRSPIDDTTPSSSSPLRSPPPTSAKPQRTEEPRPLNPPAWLSHKYAMQSSFPSGWSPPKRVSREALSLIRLLQRSDPQKYTTPVLAERFKISPEAVRRILKSAGGWEMDGEEAERRERRRRDERVREFGGGSGRSSSTFGGGEGGDEGEGGEKEVFRTSWAGDLEGERLEMGRLGQNGEDGGSVDALSGSRDEGNPLKWVERVQKREGMWRRSSG